MLSLMLFLFLFFFGILATLFHIQRSQEKNFQQLRAENMQLHKLLQALQPQTHSGPGRQAAPAEGKTPDEQLSQLTLTSTASQNETAPYPDLELHLEPPAEAGQGSTGPKT